MLTLSSDIEGIQSYYGDMKDAFEKAGFCLCGNWEYSKAYFDSILSQNGGTTIYLRLPVRVVRGKLDRKDAYLELGRPFLIKHIVHTGMVEEDFSSLDLVGLNQFQAPLDPDDRIKHESKWRQAGEEVLNRIKPFIQ